MSKKRGVIDPFLLLVIIAVVAVVIYLVSKGIIPNPLQTLQSAKKPTIQLQTQYKNPFEEKTQYVNPFSSYKNPFDTLK